MYFSLGNMQSLQKPLAFVTQVSLSFKFLFKFKAYKTNY